MQFVDGGKEKCDMVVLHEGESAASAAGTSKSGKSTTVCRFFKMGKCSKGAKCKYLHDSVDDGAVIDRGQSASICMTFSTSKSKRLKQTQMLTNMIQKGMVGVTVGEVRQVLVGGGEAAYELEYGGGAAYELEDDGGAAYALGAVGCPHCGRHCC